MDLVWGPVYATNVPEIDRQHQQLFAIVNDLGQRLRRQEPVEQLAGILASLADYAASHFACEEGLMERCGCPTACVNRLAHQRFSRTVQASLEECRRAPTRALFEHIHRETAEWLKEHIGRIDLKMRDSAAATAPAR